MLAMAMPMMEGSLEDEIYSPEFVAQARIKPIVKMLLEGLGYIHGLNIMHRDLKPANVLLKAGKVKLSDFGLATRFKDDCKYLVKVGTITYYAPEMFSKHGYDKRIDIWVSNNTKFIKNLIFIKMLSLISRSI